MQVLDEAAFCKWLVGAGYRPQTARKYTRDCAFYLAQERPGEGCSKSRYKDLKRAKELLDWYVEDEGEGELVVPPIAPPPLEVDPRRAKMLARRLSQQQRRDSDLRSIEDSEWQRLWDHTKMATVPAARVIEVMMATGLRIGDVLRVSLVLLGAALRRKDGVFELEVKGGKSLLTTVNSARESWQGLYDACGDAFVVGDAVAPGMKKTHTPDAGGAGAYQAVARLLKILAADAKVTGRVNPHRLRRTVGVQTARDVGRYAAQQVLGHSAAATTDIYLDENNVDIIANAQKTIAKRREKSENSGA